MYRGDESFFLPSANPNSNVLNTTDHERFKHYHGGPMWGGLECFNALYRDSYALVSFARPQQLKRILAIAKGVILDNGAYSIWLKEKKGKLVVDWANYWTRYYMFVGTYYQRIDWFLIPDVIGGTEEENDVLINRVPSMFAEKAVPVWHAMESLERLGQLCKRFDRVAISDHRASHSHVAKARLKETFEYIYIHNNFDVKIHGLKILDGRIVGKYPFASGDATSVAINMPKNNSEFPAEKRKLNRTVILKSKIERVISPSINEWRRSYEISNNLPG